MPTILKWNNIRLPTLSPWISLSGLVDSVLIRFVSSTVVYVTVKEARLELQLNRQGVPNILLPIADKRRPKVRGTCCSRSLK